jgi:glycosyltransferase involved in cell wall biosynthesis
MAGNLGGGIASTTANDDAGAPAESRSEAPRGARAGGGLLVLDTSYTLDMIRERGLQSTVTCRDLDGFFDHVWSVHPFATLLSSEDSASAYGRPVWTEFAPRHTVIEGKKGRFRTLRRLFPLNFLLGQIGLVVALLRLIRRENIKVVRVGDPLYLGLFGLLLARLSGIPMAIRVNGNNAKVRRNTGAPVFPRLFRTAAVEERVERFVFPRTDLVAALNPENLEFALDSGAREDCTTLFRLGNLIAPEHLLEPEKRGPDFPILERLGLQPGHFLLTIGRLEPLKFPEDVVRVLHRLVAEGWKLKLVFAGDGALREPLVAQATELGVLDSIVFAGNLNQDALAQLIPNAAVVVSPFTGRALSEAAFGAAPIAAYDADWQAELIETGVTGELVALRDWEGLAAAVLKLLGDRTYASAMGRAVRERALRMLDPAALSAHERAEYAAMLERHRR